MRRDGRHRHEPARRVGGRSARRAARRAGDRHADEPPRLRRRGHRAERGASAARFAALAGRTAARRLSLANSAGIALGADYAFDLTRPGLALYGGVPRAELAGVIRQVARPEAQILQRRRVAAGETVGYNATWTAPADTEVAIVNLGYADGYLARLFGTRRGAGRGRRAAGARPRIDGPDRDRRDRGAGAGEGDWVRSTTTCPRRRRQSGMSQYELLTGLGARFERV